MMRLRDLTLATTAHNNAEMSADMLRSFEQHVGLADEIVVVDDASKHAFAPPDLQAPVRVIETDTPHGFCKASDLALQSVRTRYALLVDADVLFQPGDFAGGYAEFQNGHWAWVNFRQVNFQGASQDAFEQPLMPPWVFAAGNQVLAWWEKFQHRPVGLHGSRILEVQVAHSSCTLVEMEMFREVGGFDSWYWQCQSDTDLSLRFREKGFRVGVDTGYCVKHEGTGGKTGGASRVMDLYRSRVRLYEKFYPSSRFYLRPALFVRHLLELVWFGFRSLYSPDPRLRLRLAMVKGALHGYK